MGWRDPTFLLLHSQAKEQTAVSVSPAECFWLANKQTDGPLNTTSHSQPMASYCGKDNGQCLLHRGQHRRSIDRWRPDYSFQFLGRPCCTSSILKHFSEVFLDLTSSHLPRPKDLLLSTLWGSRYSYSPGCIWELEFECG